MSGPKMAPVGVEVQRGLSILARRDQTLFDARDGHVFGHVVKRAEFFMLFVKQYADHGCLRRRLYLLELFCHA